MQDGPDPDLWRSRRKRKRRRSEVQSDFGREHRHDHFDDERNRNEPGQKAGYQEQATGDLEDRNKVRGRPRRRNADLREPADSLVHVHELQNSFPEEHAAGHQADQHRRARRGRWRIQEPVNHFS